MLDTRADAPARAVLDRARKHVPRAALPDLIMSDPGSGGYIAAYTRVLAGGAAALFEEYERGTPLIQSFDITETLLLSHSDAGQSMPHRWFSVLTACIELLGAAVYRDVPLANTLAGLLTDFFAERPEFGWGPAVRRSELPAWLELVEHHFPRSPELAATTRERLLHE